MVINNRLITCRKTYCFFNINFWIKKFQTIFLLPGLYGMTTHKYTIFPIKFNYNGMGFETKVLTYTYRNEILYKMAMPSAVSAVQQCWIAVDKHDQWKLIMGAVDETLLQQMITAIKKQEKVMSIYADTEPNKQELKSA